MFCLFVYLFISSYVDTPNFDIRLILKGFFYPDMNDFLCESYVYKVILNY